MVQSLEECFKRIARAEKGNGRIRGGDDIIEGMKIFRKDILGENNLSFLKVEELAQRLFYMEAFKTLDDARKFCQDYPFQQEIEDDKGVLYFERRGKGNRIAIGYSTNE